MGSGGLLGKFDGVLVVCQVSLTGSGGLLGKFDGVWWFVR